MLLIIQGEWEVEMLLVATCYENAGVKRRLMSQPSTFNPLDYAGLKLRFRGRRHKVQIHSQWIEETENYCREPYHGLRMWSVCS